MTDVFIHLGHSYTVQCLTTRAPAEIAGHLSVLHVLIEYNLDISHFITI